MSVRLNKVTKEFNIGLQTAVEFLQKKGFTDVESNPNYKISDEQFNLLQQEFSTDKSLRTEAKVLIQQRQEQTKERKKPAPVLEEYVEEKPRIQGPKILGQIDLGGKKPQPKREEVKPEQEAPKPEEVKPEQEAPKAPEAPEVQEVQEVQEVPEAPEVPEVQVSPLIFYSIHRTKIPYPLCRLQLLLQLLYPHDKVWISRCSDF